MKLHLEKLRELKMKHEFIETDNYINCLAAIRELDRLPDHSHKMALFYGKFGRGKTIALEKLSAEQNTILVRTLGGWTAKSMLVDICFELGVDDTGSAAALEQRIISELIENPRAIIIDEIDTILNAKHNQELLILRDIHDMAKIPLIFTGMEKCIKLLKRDEHYFSRFVKTVKIKANTKNDISKYCRSSCIEIKDDLVSYFHKEYANLRQIKTLIIRLEDYCDTNDEEVADLKLLKISNIEKQHDI